MLRIITMTVLAAAFVSADPITHKNIGSVAKRIEAGNYYLENVATGDRMTYEPDSAQSWYPKAGAGSIVQIKPYAGVKAVISPGGEDNRNKCASSQWTIGSDDIGYNWSAALYNCALLGFNGVAPEAAPNARDGPVRLVKQQYWFTPSRSGKGTYKITGVDHAHDMPLRCFSSQTRTAVYDDKMKMVALEECRERNPHQHWRLIRA